MTGALASYVAWSAYGLMAHEPLQMVVNGSGVAAVTCTLIIMSRHDPIRMNWAVCVLGLFFFALLTWLLGSVVPGSFGFILGTASLLPQVVKSWRNPGGAAVSITSFSLRAVNNTAWIVYGFLYRDFLLVSAAALVTLMAVFVALQTAITRGAQKGIPERTADASELMAS